MTGETGSHVAHTWGARAERAACRKYGLVLAKDARKGDENYMGARSRWWDAKYRSNGRKVQIKACMKERSDGSKGRFRIWLDDHKELKKAHGSYVLVVYQPNSKRPIRKIWKASVSDVDALAEWGPSGQRLRSGSGKQVKIRWDLLL